MFIFLFLYWLATWLTTSNQVNGGWSINASLHHQCYILTLHFLVGIMCITHLNHYRYRLWLEAFLCQPIVALISPKDRAVYGQQHSFTIGKVISCIILADIHRIWPHHTGCLPIYGSNGSQNVDCTYKNLVKKNTYDMCLKRCREMLNSSCVTMTYTETNSTAYSNVITFHVQELFGTLVVSHNKYRNFSKCKWISTEISQSKSMK